MKVKKKIIDENGQYYLIASDRDFAINQDVRLLTKEEYVLWQESHGTARQNKFFHALIADVYNSHAWSIAGKTEAEQDAMTLDEFREWIKVEFGQGYKCFAWFDKGGRRRLTKNRPDPKEALYEFYFGYTKSWAKYSKEERRQCISSFVAWVEAQGIAGIIDKYIPNLF